jgi:photosystem II stability/assembly factor-like uncharacterized protein
VIGLVNAPARYQVELELTTDFVHWRNITPPLPGPAQYGGTAVLRNVSFPTPDDGWVVAGLPSNALELYRTTDGGVTWQDEGGVTSGGSAGDELIDFLDASRGWREIIASMAGTVSLSSSDDGGETWTSVTNPGMWPSEGVLTFSSVSHGFIADTLPPSQDLPSGQSIPGFTPLWETTDGGQTWHQASITLPPGFAGAQSYEGLPTFTDANDGVLPVVLFLQNEMSIAFYVTSDGGDSWSYESLVGLGSTANTGVYLNNQLPSVAIAGPNTWWVVSVIRPHGSPTVHVTNDAGRSWTAVSPRGLPSTLTSTYPMGITSVQSTSATTAWAMLENGPSCGLYGTTDGGATWTPVCPR